ncbi:hypothetical protein JI747_019650 [Chryseobacterium sp. RG1]|uniref:Uncharacterized protein n=1 Tax=Chryseobacterium tagetis TaxID=2801334 RepID=A0ABS8A5Y5_9FLAO|nr:hypothetical protein [Chryseobacterium tagetis]MCA6069388.1 hypothetical protein [Chryseobacterium tagetis]
MKNLIKILIFAFAYFSNYAVVYAQSIDCSRNNTIQANNQKIREVTYQYIRLAASQNTNKEIMNSLALDYIEIQTSFNALFTSMKEDKANFASKKKICTRYSKELLDLTKKANDYDKRIFEIISPNTKSTSFGVSDVLSIIDWLFKKHNEGTETFYNKLKWDDWEDVIKSKK